MSETMRGAVRAIAIEDGIERDPYCGLEDCECPDHEYTPPAGVYLTIRLDDNNPAIRGWHLRDVVITWADSESNGEGQG